jgi:hypothetical protein
MIKNREFRINRQKIAAGGSLSDAITKLAGDQALRWYISQITADEIVIEATLCDEKFAPFGENVQSRYYPGKSAVLNIIPTGVGCSIGGYAGDATPVTNLLASTVDYLITNPNSVNASDFISLANNVIYTDGASIDLFCQGRVDLHLPYANRIGLVMEKSDDWKLDLLFNVVNAVRAIHGVTIVDYVITDKPVGSRCVQNKSGAFVGTIDNPETVLGACEHLIKRGANAIAITTNVQDLPADKYARHFAGEAPNPVGGVEAIISYLIAKRFQIPAAHAPLLNIKELDLRQTIVDARGAGEMTSRSGLACILIGLHRAPQIRANPDGRVADIININNLLAMVTPAGCLGGVPALSAQKYGVPIIAVHENHTILEVTQSKIRLNNIIEVRSYAEAAGIILALKKGINLESTSRPLRTLRY